jgi:hypothetical protein
VQQFCIGVIVRSKMYLCPVVYSVPAQAIFTLAQSNSRIQKVWELRLLIRSDPSYCIRLFTLSGSIANIFCFAII